MSGCKSEPLSSGGTSSAMWTADAEVLNVDLNNKVLTLELEEDSDRFDSRIVVLDYSELYEVSKDPTLLNEGNRIRFSCYYTTPSKLFRIDEIY